jgi:serine/threonine protein kinase
MKGLDHPNIVKFYDSFIDSGVSPEQADTADTLSNSVAAGANRSKGTLNIVMSFAENGDLNHVSKNSKT